jgi:hypothetical protein
MKMLATIEQGRTCMGLTRQQLVSAIVLLALLVAIAVALVGATIYSGEQAFSIENASLIAGVRRPGGQV